MNSTLKNTKLLSLHLKPGKLWLTKASEPPRPAPNRCSSDHPVFLLQVFYSAAHHDCRPLIPKQHQKPSTNELKEIKWTPRRKWIMLVGGRSNWQENHLLNELNNWIGEVQWLFESGRSLLKIGKMLKKNLPNSWWEKILDQYSQPRVNLPTHNVS